MAKFPTPEEYYELYDKYISSKKSDEKKEYEKLLMKLSNQTDSRTFFEDPSSKRPYSKRENLHQKIFKDILGKCQSSKKPRIHLLLGSIGSGKTSAKDTILKIEKRKENFIFINFDDIKKKIPEYDLLKKLNPKKAATFVQPESAKIAGKLFKKAYQKKYDIIFEKNIRKDTKGKIHLIKEIKDLLKKNYQILIHIVFLDTYAEAWKRVQKRAEEIKRFVPAKIVKETFSNLFPHFNIVQESFSKKSSILIYLWYNGSNVKENELISTIRTGKWPDGHDITEEIDQIKILSKKDHYIHWIEKNRFKLLPKEVVKNLKKLVFFENYDSLNNTEGVEK